MKSYINSPAVLVDLETLFPKALAELIQSGDFLKFLWEFKLYVFVFGCEVRRF